MTHTEESLMELADIWRCSDEYGLEAENALRLAIREVLAERDSCAQMVISAERQRDKQARRAEKAEAENLQRGNVIGRITAHLLGNKNNVSDEDVVIAAAEVGRELQGAIERIKRSDKACPVAWMVYTKDGKSVFVTDNPTDIPAECAALPLFTSPPAAPAPETVAWMIVEPGCECGPTFSTENAAWSALTKAPPGSELIELIRRPKNDARTRNDFQTVD